MGLAVVWRGVMRGELHKVRGDSDLWVGLDRSNRKEIRVSFTFKEVLQ
jgi:hypothetical protein